MPYGKKFMCLANSRKLNGTCVAGKLLDGTKVGGWIRPVSNSPTGELKNRDRRYRDGVDPKLFDIIEVQFLRPQEHAYQSENHVIDDKMYWVRAGRATTAQVKAAIDQFDGALWENQSSSTDGLHGYAVGNVESLHPALVRLPASPYSDVYQLPSARRY